MEKIQSEQDYIRHPKRRMGRLHPVLFSVVTPSYKQLEYLKTCVASVRDQVFAIHPETRPDGAGIVAPGSTVDPPFLSVRVEHIIQDAGTPGIEEFAREIGAEYISNGRLVSPGTTSLAETGYSIQVVNEADDGMYDAINRGFRRATGDFMAWLNCDEQYLPGTLRKAAEFFLDHPSKEVLFGDALLSDEQGGILSYRRTVLPWRLHTQISHLSSLSCSTFVRGTVIQRGVLLDPTCKAIADAKWVARLLDEKVPMAVLREPLAVFFLTESNLGQSSLAYTEALRWKNELGILKRCLEYIVIPVHRFKKLFAGAYGSHTVNSFIYLRDGQQQRRWTFSSQVPFSWPEKRRIEEGSPKPAPRRTAVYEFVKRGVLLPLLFLFSVLCIDKLVPQVTVTPFLSISALMCMAFYFSPLCVGAAASIFLCGVVYALFDVGNASPGEPHNLPFISVRIAGFIISSTVAVLFSYFRQKAFFAQKVTAAILSSLPIPVLITDAAGSVTTSNLELQRRLGIGESQMAGKTWAGLVMANEDEGQATRTYIEMFSDSSAGGSEVTLHLAGNSGEGIRGRLLCIGEGVYRRMVTVVLG